CTNPQLGQVEDYTVIVEENTLPPVAAFSFTSEPCSATFSFTDASNFSPDTFAWDFGDGATSTEQNPEYTYAEVGTYQVRLIVANAFGADTLTQTLTFRTPPRPAACVPTLPGGGGLRLGRVVFAGINNTSGNDGYSDFSCDQQTTVVAGETYAFEAQTNSFREALVQAFIDWNDDGEFSREETIYRGTEIDDHEGSVRIPADVITGRPLRMRVISEEFSRFSGELSGCAIPNLGEVEDYAVLVTKPEAAPEARFVAFDLTGCSGVVQFKDTTLAAVDDYAWDFGDGATSTEARPRHTYAESGTYTVSLTVTNAAGTDALTKTDYVAVTDTLRTAPVACRPQTLSQFFTGFGTSRVRLGALDNQTADATTDGYQDYTCTDTVSLLTGTRQTLRVNTFFGNQHLVKAWIDWNNDGAFDTTELVLSGADAFFFAQEFIVPPDAVRDVGLRLRVISASLIEPEEISACSDVELGQVEDYAVFVRENVNPPVAAFVALDSTSCDGVVTFSDSSLNAPTSYLWDFGDGATSTEANPTHTYTASGTYTVRLIVRNDFGTDTLTRTDYVSAFLGELPADISCQPTSINESPGFTLGILRVEFGGIDFSSGDITEGYGDFTCAADSAEVIQDDIYTLRVTTGGLVTESVGVWIDWNNDASFALAERVMITSNTREHATTVRIPADAVLDRPLRMRVMSDFIGEIRGACTDPLFGQAEDYKVVVRAVDGPPTADFTLPSRRVCLGEEITFTDLSTKLPSTWRWEFGNGESSTEAEPTVTYTTPGRYDVRLVAGNAFGNDTLVRTAYVEVVAAGPPVETAAICTPFSFTSSRQVPGILAVVISGDTARTAGDVGYQDYTCAPLDTLAVGPGAPGGYTLRVRTGPNDPERVRAWIDWNNDGRFRFNEVINFATAGGTGWQTANFSVPSDAVRDQPLRVRVSSVIIIDGFTPAPQPCDDVQDGQTEDFGIVVQQVVSAAAPAARPLRVMPNPSGGRVSIAVPGTHRATRLVLTNALGQVVFVDERPAVHEATLTYDWHALPRGVYFLHLAGYAPTPVVLR
ncbi:MAG: PKD domain-containing protein, partial [Catalinimonas sp.]